MKSFKITVSGTREAGNQLSFSTNYTQSHCRSIKWTFGDGETSKSFEPKHTYETSGIKRITCLINNRDLLRKTIQLAEPVDPNNPVEPLTNGVSLRVVNNTSGANPINILLFQKNAVDSIGAPVIAWRVLNLIETYTIAYEVATQINISDNFGNYTPLQTATSGQKYRALDDISGLELVLDGSAGSMNEIDIFHAAAGPITGYIYRSGHLLGQSPTITYEDTTSFDFRRATVWIGVVSEVEQGQALDEITLSDVNTEISLLGIASADIVVTGGGVGPSATPYSFSLANIVYA